VFNDYCKMTKIYYVRVVFCVIIFVIIRQAKWFASVKWLLAKAGGGTYPAEYGEPFINDEKVHASYCVM